MRGSPVVWWGWAGFYGGFIYQVKSKVFVCYAFWLLGALRIVLRPAIRSGHLEAKIAG